MSDHRGNQAVQFRTVRGAGPQRLADVLAEVLAHYESADLESSQSPQRPVGIGPESHELRIQAAG